MSNILTLRADGSIDQTIVDLGADWESVELASDAFGFATSMVEVDGEGGAADDLATITGGGTGKLILLKIADADHPITLKHMTGNLWLPTLDDILLDDPKRVVMLLYTGSVWSMRGAAGGAAGELVADFSWVADGLTVDFTDLSTGTPVSWDWDFGDSGTSTSQNPSHSYGAAGYYDVTLTVEDADSNTDSITRRVFVNADYWQREWDFREGGGGWYIANNYVAALDDVGALTGAGFEDTLKEVAASPDSDYLRGITVQCDVPITTHIRRLWFFGVITPGTFTSSTIVWANRRILLSGSVQQEANTSASSIPTLSSIYYLTTLAPNPAFDVNQLSAGLACGKDTSHPLTDPGGTLTLVGVIAVGDGENPWGENNCSQRLVLTQQPTSEAEDTAISPAITLQVWNRFDVLENPGAMQVTVSIGSNPGGATLGGTTTRTFSAATVTFNDLTISEPGSGYTLVFEVTSIDTSAPQNYTQFKPLSVESDSFDIS